jgi:uncharacterized membrane protein YecN with MAPEG domain
MSIAIIPLYAALLAVLFVYLSIRVIRMRRQAKVAVGDNDNMLLRRAMRVRANFAEYVPLALLLAAFAELQCFSSILAHAIGLTLLTGRFIHAYGVSQERENYRFRTFGMTLMFLAVGTSSLVLIGSYVVGH